MQLDKALEYLRTRPVTHTSNQWRTNDRDSKEVSNMFYKMWYRIYERTAFSHTQKKSVSVAREITWGVCLNLPSKPEAYYNGTVSLAGQEKKIYKKYMNVYFEFSAAYENILDLANQTEDIANHQESVC